jgi:hypothetical protein
MMENTQNKPNSSKERRPYTRPEVKKLGKLNLLIKGYGSCGPNDNAFQGPPGSKANKTPNC